VEIGGGFRVPDVMAQSGALLREVGTTNRTRVADYAAAISDRTALILRVHPSNFTMEGFTERASLDDWSRSAADSLSRWSKTSAADFSRRARISRLCALNPS
jgi:L-seryl-tRNA(Ser) seleniumtransferase